MGSIEFSICYDFLALSNSTVQSKRGPIRNVNTVTLEMVQGCDRQKRDLFVAQLLTSKCCSLSSSVFTDYAARKTNWTSSLVSCKNHDNSSCWGNF